ncbi:MAG: TIGR02710 family CRISPR-associated CARF protein [Candidatus Bipolaricaulaceae bacterium]
MKRKVLAVTVGGEPDPIVKAISQHRPDFTIFFVTTEPGGGSRRFLLEDTEKGASILKRTGLAPEAYEIVTLPNPDDFEDCFNRMVEVLREYERAGERLADYTGGTKTMSAALVAAALLQGWSLSLVSGERRDTVKVAKGTELARRVRSAPFFLEHTLIQTRVLYEHHEFASAAELLQELLSAAELPPQEQRRLTRLCTFLRALAAWDRFAYSEAYDLLRTVGEAWPEGCKVLAQILGDKMLNYKVADLVGNALRRADQARYEDAVLRLYRAVELLAQLRLQIQYQQDPGNLNLEALDMAALPPDLAQRLRDRKEKEGRAWVGLVEAYEVLASLHDPIGGVFREQQDPIKDLLGQRNNLLLIHGLKPIAKEDWERSHRLACDFLEGALEAVGLTFSPLSFPRWEEVRERILSV